MNESPIQILPNYHKCIGKNCKNKNAQSVKKVFKDVGFLPLCPSCRIEMLRDVKRLCKQNVNLDSIEILKIYIESGYADYLLEQTKVKDTNSYSIKVSDIKSYTECVELISQMRSLAIKCKIEITDNNGNIIN